MSYRSCPTLEVFLVILGLWTTTCSSYPSFSGNGTAIPTSTFSHTRPVNAETQEFGDVVSTEVSNSQNSTTSSQLSSSQSGCSYVLAYATFWPGPSVITRTDSTICPSLASMAAALIIDTHELIVCSVCNANPNRRNFNPSAGLRRVREHDFCY
jgi:hypothetical protein